MITTSHYLISGYFESHLFFIEMGLYDISNYVLLYSNPVESLISHDSVHTPACM